MGKLKYEELTYKIRGAFFKVYNEIGPGFKESIYHNALAIEFQENKIPYQDNKRILILYKGKRVGIYEPDFAILDKIIIEIKAVPSIMPKIFDTQLYYYLKGSKYELGFLVNFGSSKIEIKRRIFDSIRDNPRTISAVISD